MASITAYRVAADGRREVLGFQVGESEDAAFWAACLRSLKSCGLAGVQLVVSDAHSGLRAAIEAILIGASWQRCGSDLGPYVPLFVLTWARRTVDCSSTAWGPLPVSTRTAGSQITFMSPGLGAAVSTL